VPTAEERHRWDLQVAALRELETDEVPASTEQTLAWANEMRGKLRIAAAH